ncbi:MAG: hypothetical protein K5745_02185, partial [Saccharofermentans sp.]|nr:hypothetical protein [Saccharofermentans sp.]
RLTLDDIKFENEIGCTLKLIAFFGKSEGKPSVYVAPHYVSSKNLLSSVSGVFNAIVVEGNCLGESMYYGQGAGKLPTASAVCADILEAAVTGGVPSENRLWSEEAADIASYEDIVCDIVVRLDGGADKLMSVFAPYEPVKLSGNAILAKGIKHSDIESILKSEPDSKWFHYLG